ncbi:dipeptidase [Anaerotignum faecicola]|nr:dipeptidase [Anaerotignum faecicola]
MGIKTGYKGYKAYSYLEAGKDYKDFELADWNWAGEYRLPLDEEQEVRVKKLAEESIIISLHEHPVHFPKKVTEEEILSYNQAGRNVCAYEALSHSCLDCVFDNMMDGLNTISSKWGWKWQDIIHDLGMRMCDIAHQDFLIHCRTTEDIIRAHKEGKIAWVASIEGAAPIENDPDRIDILYGLGVRLLGLVYSESNALGSGIKETNDGGLTRFGQVCVDRMNKLGMLIDVSHCGPQTAFDAATYSKDPIVATHVGARALWDSKRLAEDRLFKAIAEKGGLVCIESAPHTTMTMTNKTHDLESTMEHFEYIANLIGIDHVGFGPDTLYGDHVGVHHAFAKTLSTKAVLNQTVSYDEVPFVKGLENPTEAMWNILRWLVKHGYSDEDIQKVLGKNAMRVLKQVWGA